MNIGTCFLMTTGTDPVLQWACFFLLSGTIFWGIMLRILSRGFLGPGGKLFSIFALQFPFSHNRFRQLLKQFPVKSLKPLQWSLKVDYLFMAFAYPLLACSAWFLFRNDRPSGFLAVYEANLYLLLRWCIALPFAAWLLDIAENILLLSCLPKPRLPDSVAKPAFTEPEPAITRLRSRALLGVALLKWACVVFVVLVLLVVTLSRYWS